MSNLISRLRTKCKMLHQCVDMRREAANRIVVLEAALDRLSKLGNEPHYGNSTGNVIARIALEDES